MIIKRMEGFELEKDLRNQPTDLFNRSEITISESGNEKEFHVVYLRYFDEKLDELTPFTENPVLTVQGMEIFLKDIVAVVAAIQNRELVRNNKRIYINDEKRFQSLFNNVDINLIGSVVEAISTKGEAKL